MVSASKLWLQSIKYKKKRSFVGATKVKNAEKKKLKNQHGQTIFLKRIPKNPGCCFFFLVCNKRNPQGRRALFS
jgi:hypothetical protein